ncbi:MAG: chemotaxis protein CheB [Acidobacteria bacterium]|nr:chemotaxis protein CheB [Acidobacteriota bacterium]
MPGKEIVVIGTSTGGIDALKVLVGGLPRDLRASVLIVLHIAPYGLGILPEILERAGPLPASNARDWEELRPGHIYVAPPDYHLLVDRSGYTRVTQGPRENRFRPAVDPLFRSAALAYGPRVIGVVLTGWLDDGTAGLHAIKERGGTTVVQHPEDALAPSMPLNALKHVEVDYCVSLSEIAPLLVRLTETPAAEEGEFPVPERMETEVKIAMENKPSMSEILKWGDPSLYACPECHGTLLQLVEGNHLRFRCHTGHAYSTESLMADMTEKTEESLWGSIRSLEEHVLLLRHLAGHLGEHEGGAEAEALLQKARELQESSNLVRQAAMNHKNQSGD